MKVTQTAIPEVLVIEPTVFSDDRGFFFESFNQRQFEEAINRKVSFVQDNHSRSSRGVLRGLHYQIAQPQGKLVRAIAGEIFDVAVDIRRSSPTFGRWVGTTLSADNKLQVWIPEGFAHGFVTLSDTAELLYKVTDYYDARNERCIIWNDEDIAIDWPVTIAPILSRKDAGAVGLAAADVFA